MHGNFLRALSSAGLERHVYTVEVTGSIPVVPTRIKLSDFFPTDSAALRAATKLD